MRHSKQFFILIQAILITSGLLLTGTYVQQAAAADENLWLQPVPPPGPNQIINPEYIRLQKELNKIWTQQRRQRSDARQSWRWTPRGYSTSGPGKRTYSAKPRNVLRTNRNVQELQRELKDTPMYLAVTPETPPTQAGTVTADAPVGTVGAPVADLADVIPPGACAPEADASEAMTKLIINTILFDLNSSVLRPEEALVLQEAANELKQNPGTSVVIVGHACDLGTEEYNQWLSERRAATARKFLLDQGIDASRLAAEGVGEGCPVADNAIPGNRERNRRVEFFVIE